MSGREWKPGDVAMVTGPAPYVDQGDDYSATSTEVACSFTVDGLWKPLDRRDFGFQAHEARTARPLVVIDPEDREKVERLTKHLPIDWNLFQPDDPDLGEGSVDAMQAALREFADPEPPKPEEPTGLGAVVEAINLNYFIHMGDGAWRRVGDGWDNVCTWPEIDVVGVLSEGVQAGDSDE